MEATQRQLVAANATGCLEVFSTPYPETSWQIPWIHSLFGNTAAVATGIAAALKAKGKNDVRVIAQGGDGGTTDIGFGCLSGMFERNDDVLYICYDNEAYMNTGVQRSSATPPAARTATTSVGISSTEERARDRHRARYSVRRHGHDRAPARPRRPRCAARWNSAARATSTSMCPARSAGGTSDQSVRIARLAKETGIFPVFEAEHGEVVSVAKIRKQLPVEEYLKPQKRFAHFSPKVNTEAISRIQEMADRNIRKFGLLDANCSPLRSILARALPTTPARRTERRCMWTACRRATRAAPQERISRAGSGTQSPATTKPHGACSRRTTRCPRSWAASATTCAKRRATVPSSTRRRHQFGRALSRR